MSSSFSNKRGMTSKQWSRSFTNCTFTCITIRSWTCCKNWKRTFTCYSVACLRIGRPTCSENQKRTFTSYSILTNSTCWFAFQCNQHRNSIKNCRWFCYLQIDWLRHECVDEVVNYPIEFINSLDPPSVPTHKLSLKVGVPIIFLRNINPPRVCNRLRLAVKKLMSNVIEATILNGK